MREIVQLVADEGRYSAVINDGTLVGWRGNGRVLPKVGLDEIVRFDPIGGCGITQNGRVQCEDDRWEAPVAAPADSLYQSTLIPRSLDTASTVSVTDALDVIGPYIAHADGTVSMWLKRMPSVPGFIRFVSLSDFNVATMLDRDGHLWRFRGTFEPAFPDRSFLDFVEHKGRSIDERCWITADGAAHCEGYLLAVDLPASPDDPARSVALGATRACVLTRSGHVTCFSRQSNTPELVNLEDVTHLAASGKEHCAVRKGREVWCFGSLDAVAPRQVPNIDAAKQVVALGTARAALTLDGGVITWGTDTTSKLAPSALPHVRAAHVSSGFAAQDAVSTFDVERVTGTFPSLEAVEVSGIRGVSTPCVRTARGGVRCQTASGDTETWADVAGLPKVVALAQTEHEEHCALDQRRRVWCWRPGKSMTAKPAAGFGEVEALWLRQNGRDCLLRQGGALECRGGTSLFTLENVARFSLAPMRGCAALRNGHVACWVGVAAPDEVPLLDDATDVAVSATGACAVRRSGQVWCWGSSEGGQLGDGSGTLTPLLRYTLPQ